MKSCTITVSLSGAMEPSKKDQDQQRNHRHPAQQRVQTQEEEQVAPRRQAHPESPRGNGQPLFQPLAIAQNQAKLRLDQYLTQLHLPGLQNRSQLKRSKLEVRLGGKSLKLSHIVENGQTLEIQWEAPPLTDGPLPMALNILYEDAQLIGLNKPQGLAVHRAPSLRPGEPSLVQGLIYHYPELLTHFASEADLLRPGIVHRLDKGTSGVLLVARNPESHAALSAQFAARTVHKVYVALVRGRPPQLQGLLDLPIGRDPRDPQRYTVYAGSRLSYLGQAPGRTPQGRGGLDDDDNYPGRLRLREAQTFYRCLKSWEYKNEVFSLLRLEPQTGRTHQLRVHLSYIGCPIVGDPTYGSKAETGVACMMLHALQLHFCHPASGQAMSFRAPTPLSFRRVLGQTLGWEANAPLSDTLT